jgi:hypothetical protein
VAALFTPTLVACLAITSAVHIAVYMLNTTLPLRMVALGASKTQVGLLFSVGAGLLLFVIAERRLARRGRFAPTVAGGMM